MGIKENLADMYYALEDKLYSMGINPKLFFGALGVLLILIIAFFLAGLPLAAGSSVLTVAVFDGDAGTAIEDSYVVIAYNGETAQGKTDEYGEVDFSVPIGASVEIAVERSGYKNGTKSIYVENALEQAEVELYLEEGAEKPVTKTIRLLGADGTQLVGKEVTVSFACSNPGVNPVPTSKKVTAGEVTVLQPAGCGTLSARAVSAGYLESSMAIDDVTDVIRLSAGRVVEGVLAVSVQNQDDLRAIDGAKVSLYNSDNVLLESSYTEWGEVRFSKPPGYYYLTVEDEQGNYAMESGSAEIVGNLTTNKSFMLSQTIKANLRVSVYITGTTTYIGGAEVELLNQNSRPMGKQSVPANGGDVKFSVKDYGTYVVRASAEGYLASEDLEIVIDGATPAAGGDLDVRIELEQLSPLNSGKVVVQVFDEDGIVVENALVSLADADTEFLTAWAGETTDSNGVVEFLGVREGKYFAIVHKLAASGTSAAFNVVIDELSNARVDMVIGKGILEIEAVDADGRPIPFADVEIIADNGDEMGTISTDEEGIARKEIKADKRVHFKVGKEDYTAWHSISYQMYPGTTTAVKAALEEEILGEEPVVLFMGMYRENAKAGMLEAGNYYTAKFIVKVPSEADYRQMGLNVRVGQSNELAKDKIYINSINAPGAMVARGTTFDSLARKDMELPTLGDAKWAQVTWANDIPAGLYNIEVEMKVRDDTVQGREIPVSYSAWASTTDAGLLRDPIDISTGEAPENALYANAYTKYFYEGKDETCEGDFCYSERVFDVKEGLYLMTDPYGLRIFQDEGYKLRFSITNNSQTVYSPARIRIRNTTDGVKIDRILEMSSHTIINADAQEYGSTVPSYDIGGSETIDIGRLGQYRTVQGEIMLLPEKVGPANLLLEVISEGYIVYQKNISFTIASQKDMVLKVTPAEIPAYDVVMLEVEAQYGESDEEFAGEPIRDVQISLRRKDPNLNDTARIHMTNAQGRTAFAIGPWAAGTKIVIEAQKPGFAPVKVEKEIGKDVFEVEPSSLSATLDLTNVRSETLGLSVKNLLRRSLETEEIVLSGGFDGLLDLAAMASALAAYNNQEIEGEKSLAVRVPVKLSSQADALKQAGYPQGAIVVEMTNPYKPGAWVKSVPLSATINLIQPPSDSACLNTDKAQWDAVVSSEEVEQFAFEIWNACMTDAGQEMTLGDLEAKLTWTGNPIGVIELTVGDAPPVVMRQGVWSRIGFDRMEAGYPYSSMLSFAPRSDHDGETAAFTIEFRAPLQTSEGKQYVTSATPITANILITSLKDCVRFEDEAGNNALNGIVMGRAENEKVFTITTKAEGEGTGCGAMEVDFRLCFNTELNGYDGCSGIGMNIADLALEGSGLSGAPPYQINNVHNDEKQITVRRATDTIPGAYDITVHARASGGTWQKIGAVPITIRPGESEFLELDRYSFFLPPGESETNQSSVATTDVVNHMVFEDVTITANMCSWGEASDNLSKLEQFGVYTAGGAVGAIAGYYYMQNVVFYGTKLLMGPVLGGIVGLVAAYYIIEELQYDCHDEEQTTDTPWQDYVVNLSGTKNTNSRGGVISHEDALSDPTAILRIMPDAYSSEDGYYAEQCEHPDDYTDNPYEYECGVSVEGTDVQNKITASWLLPFGNLDDRAGENGKQTVALAFYNPHVYSDGSGGLEDYEADFGVVTLCYKEHVHGDIRHEDAHVYCNNGQFKPFRIGPGEGQGACGQGGTVAGYVEDKVDTDTCQKFHVKFTTMIPAEPQKPVAFDTFTCGTGIGATGRSGPGAVPQVSYNWDWVGNNAIEWDSCDEGNPDAIYCDAAQFTIALSKRMKMLEDFLATNNYTFDCPEDSSAAGLAVSDATYNEEHSTHLVNPQSVGIKEILTSVDYGAKSAVVSVTIENKSAVEQTVQLSVGAPGVTDPPQCERTVIVPATGTKTVTEQCTFGNLSDGRYVAVALLSGGAPGPLDNESLSMVFNMTTPTTTPVCELTKTTETVGGEPTINKFVAATSNLSWTNEVESLEDLDNLLKFNALLMRDGYSADFRHDFARFYTENDFLNVGTWFEDDGFDRLFLEDALIFSKRYTDSSMLDSPGTYSVEIAAYFTGDDWSFIDAQGNISSVTSVLFSPLHTPEYGSPLYYMPIDGRVGLEGNALDRQGYGSGFENMGSLIDISSWQGGVKTYSTNGSNTVANVETKVEQDFYRLNSDPANRGAVLTIEALSPDNVKMTLSPSDATPVLMRMRQASPTTEPFGAFYGIAENNQPKDVGNNLTLWEGVGNCFDYSGTPVWEAFSKTPDAKATAEDGVYGWPNQYRIMWNGAEPHVQQTGGENVFLRTIFYTPSRTGANYSLHAGTPAELGFATHASGNAESPMANVSLNGVGGYSFDSVDAILDMVADGELCMRSSGNRMKVFWNEKNVYGANEQNDISKVSNCLGGVSPASEYLDNCENACGSTACSGLCASSWSAGQTQP